MRWLVAAIALASAACGKDTSEPATSAGARGPRPFPVETITIAPRDVEYAATAVGSLHAFEEIQITARVSGVVEKVRFTEGQVVKAGEPLVEIEPQRFQLAVRAARASRDRAEAALAEARAGLARREQASQQSPGLVPGEELETWRTRVRTAEAEVASARVTMDRAALDLRDAYVRAPAAGVLQTRTVRTGQFTQPGTVLATLVQRDPLLLRFDVPEGEALRLTPGTVVKFTTGTDVPYEAKVTLVSTAADQASRMVPVTAEVAYQGAFGPSPGGAVRASPRTDELRAGTFARVTIALGASQDAVVIPQVAIRPSERGFLAFVVVDDKAVERVLELGLRTADGLVEVKQGLANGDRLVVRGAEALRTGVTVIESKGPTPTARPAAAAQPGAPAP